MLNGPIMDLVAKGKQDNDFITQDIKYSLFITKIRKHTNFSKGTHEVIPDNTSSWNTTVKFTIPDYGDLLNQKDMNESFSKWTGINHEYSIYDFTNDLNIWNKNPLSFNELKTWTNHFVGDGFYEKLDDYITRVWDSMKKVDYDTINDRFLELWDDVNVDTNWILPCIAYEIGRAHV